MAAAISLATGKERRDNVFPKQPVVLEANHLGTLILALKHKGYEVFGPTARDGAIVYDRIGSPQDLPCSYDRRARTGTLPDCAARRSGLFRLCGGTTKLEKISSPGKCATLLCRASGENVAES